MNTPLPPIPLRVLRVDASARNSGSVTRDLADRLLAGLRDRVSAIEVTRRDVARGLPFVDATWIDANFTDPDARDPAQRAALTDSDALVREVMTADVLIIGVPLYNFAVPASLKAWIDQIARARLTFRYGEHGPVGLLGGKKAYLLVASGGAEIEGAADFATPWLRFVLNFLGIDDITVIAAGQGMRRGEAAREGALVRISEVLEQHWHALARAA